MKGEFDIEELKLEYRVLQLALQYLTYAVSEGRDIGKYLLNARKALQFARTLDELDENCDGCEE